MKDPDRHNPGVIALVILGLILVAGGVYSRGDLGAWVGFVAVVVCVGVAVVLVGAIVLGGVINAVGSILQERERKRSK